MSVAKQHDNPLSHGVASSRFLLGTNIFCQNYHFPQPGLCLASTGSYTPLEQQWPVTQRLPRLTPGKGGESKQTNKKNPKTTKQSKTKPPPVSYLNEKQFTIKWCFFFFVEFSGLQLCFLITTFQLMRIKM